MNCKDISRLLDEQSLAALSAADNAALEAHVAACADCADQCLAAASMARFRGEVPPLPAVLRERARQLHERVGPEACEARTRRPVIIGSLLLLGAAATMFSTVSWRDPSTASQ